MFVKTQQSDSEDKKDAEIMVSPTVFETTMR